jgi:hypothetical protein
VDDLREADPVAGPPDPDAVQLMPARGAPVAINAQYAAVVANCLDTIAMCARHRATRRLDERAAEEERILALLDAVVVCPRFPHAMVAWWREAVASPDPWKIWAPAFVIACTDGNDAGPALASLVATLADDEVEAVGLAAEAAAAGAVSDLHEVANELARDARPHARALGVELLGRLDAASAEHVLAALDPTSPLAIRWAGARAAARLPEDRRVDELLLSALHSEDDARALWEAARALAWRGLPAAYNAMRFDDALARRLGPRALLVLALFGEAGDAPIAQRIVARCGASSPVLHGLARYGHPGAAKVLLSALGDEDASDDAASALEWIFGPGPGPRERHIPERWRAHIAASGADERVRLRFGKPYHPNGVAAALREARVSREDIDFLLDEAAVRTGIAARAKTAAFVSMADPAMAAAAAALSRAKAPGDSWWCFTRINMDRGSAFVVPSTTRGR